LNKYVQKEESWIKEKSPGSDDKMHAQERAREAALIETSLSCRGRNCATDNKPPLAFYHVDHRKTEMEESIVS